MKGSGTPRPISTSAILSLLIGLLEILPCLISTVAAQAPPVIGYTKQQMATNEQQTLTASGGCGDYVWSLVAGGGALFGSGATALYTAPVSNADCRSNPTIRVTDACGQYAEKRLAVHGATVQQNYIAAIWCCEGTKWWPPVQGEFFGSCTKSTTCRGLPADYGSDSFCQYMGCVADYTAQPCTSHMLTYCSASGLEPGRYNDRRSAEIKAAGCCPFDLEGADAAGSTSLQNSTGNSNSNICGDSSYNFRSGNLYHNQDVGTLALSYNSASPDDGPLGKKWTHKYNEKLTALSDNATLLLNTEDGNVFYFRLSGGIYYPELVTGDTSRIVKNANGTYTRTTKVGMTYGFNASGYLTSITDRNGNTTTLAYSGSDLTGITDLNGRTTTITNMSGKITGVTDPMGRTHTIGYTDGYITTISDPLNNTWQYTYNATGRMLTKTDPANRTVTYTHDDSGRLLTSTDPAGKTRTMGYTQSGTTAFTEKDGGIWTYKYDPTYTVKTEVVDPLGNTKKYSYDSKRNLIKETGPDGSYTSYTYDGNSNRTSMTDPLGKTTTYTYNALNLVSSITDPRNNMTQYGYDARGNLTSITDAAGVTGFEYDGKGNITSITTPLNKTTTMTYDAANNLVSVTDPNSGTVTMTYDAVGNMLIQTDALNNMTAFQYNSLNQLVQVTDPQGNVTAFTYDHNGNRLTTTDANGKLTRYAYNFKDQLTQMIDALSNITNLSYSGAGCSSCGTGVEKLTAVTDAKIHATLYEYDLAGNLIKETDPLGKITAYTYDGKGNLLTRTSPDSRTITYGYDLNNRLTQKQYTGGAVTTYQYDDAGNLTAAGNASISYAMTYDANNRLTQMTDSNARTIQYQYDATGNRTQTITPDGRTLTYAYDDNSRLSQITAPPGAFSFTYDAANRRTARTYPNGTSSAYGYTTSSRLLGIETTKGAAAIDAVAYTHDPAGNRLTRTTPQESWTFAYDDIYRLTRAVPTGGIHQTEAYTYDAVGNRLSSEEAHPPTGSETQNYTYDDENRLTGVQVIQNGNTRELAFAYDPFGRRIARTIVRDEIGTECASPNVCPRTIHYVYDGESIILEYDPSGEVQTRYTHGPGIDEPLSVEVRNGTLYIPYFYHADGLGSITALSDSQGAVVQRYEYDTFGNPTVTPQGNITQPYAFTGREYDAETGMYFYRARYYDPKFGRFVTKDPIGFAGGDVNLYAYVGGNPVNWFDPSGLDWLDNLSNLSAGFGDTLTSGFGLTHLFGLPSGIEAIRNLWNTNLWNAKDSVDPCSGWYKGGKYGAYAWSMATTGVMGLSGGTNSVFWAGRGASAEASGLGTTIGKTPIGAILNALHVENKIVWQTASAIFAGNVRGSATAVIKHVAPQSIWTMERSILNWRGIPIIYR